MSDEGKSPISGLAPPLAGRWQPGQSGNPSGRPKKKPLTEALQRFLGGLDDAEHVEMIKAIVTKAATGDVAAFKEVADRVEGKVPTTIGGSTDHGPIQVSWKK